MDPSNQCEECGKVFMNAARLFVHQKKSCREGKRSLTELLSDARNLWKSIEEGPRKRQRLMEQDRVAKPTARPRPQRRRSVGHEDLAAVTPLGLTQPPIAVAENLTVPSDLATSDVAEGLTSTSGDILVPVTENHSQTAAQLHTARDTFGLFKQFDGLPLSHNPNGHWQSGYQQACALDFAGSKPDQAILNNQASSSQPVVDFQAPAPPRYYPYPNWSSFELGDLFWSRGTTNSLSQFKDLIGLMKHPEFSLEDIRQTDWNQVNQRLGDGMQFGLDSDIEWIDDIGPGWTTTKITFPVPFSNKGKGSKFGIFDAGVLHHRKIVSVMKERLADPVEHLDRHFQAFQLLWQPNLSKDPIRVYGEVYSSEEFRRMEEEVRGLALGPEDEGLERVVIALMVWSDATLLANFGTAKLWPCYLFFGNDSKYLRAKPGTDLCNHIAYFEVLPANFKDWYRANNGRSPTAEIITHCNREIFHRQWDILLDDELLQAMKDGIRIKCPDDVSRLFFPRIFTYSADYPEKALIGTIKYQGNAPCPRCLIRKCEMHRMGSPEDASARISGRRTDNHARQEKVRLARVKVFQEGYTVDSDKVDELLKDESWVPVDNAFSKLGAFGFDIHSALAVDLMHEFELGVWKAIFIHLIRILEADDGTRKKSVVIELDRRYRAIPSFGSDTIRRFSANASEQKRLAARDYANLLQCAIPAFDNLLLEPHNTAVHRLLFLLGEWHALAKLRMHTELTLALLETTTSELADHLRTFISSTCQAFETVETAKEYGARLKRSAKKKQGSGSDRPVPDQSGNPLIDPAPIRPGFASDATENHSGSSALPSADRSKSPAQPPLSGDSESSVAPPTPLRKGKLRKSLNLQTYKYHALGDYAEHIRRFGTTDSYSTERASDPLLHLPSPSLILMQGELEQKMPKSWFLRTNKKAYKRQLARIERRRANLRKIRRQGGDKRIRLRYTQNLKATLIGGRYCSYAVAKSQSAHQPLSDFLPVEGTFRHDPALKDFLANLQEHLGQRMEVILRDRYPHRFAAGDIMDKSFVSVMGERIYSHKTLHLTYTAYDCSEGSDIIWPAGSKANIMLLNPAYPAADVHPYIYGKVIKIYHANVVYVKGFQDLLPERLDFLWVRWYTWQGKSGGSYGMDIVSFPPIEGRNAFGFVDPGEVLRASHIIPRFSAPPLQRLASLSKTVEDKEDSAAYLVNHLADRDMSMRYRWGFAVGHSYTHGVNFVETISTSQQGTASSTFGRVEESHSNMMQCTVTQGQMQGATCDEDEMVYERSDVECGTSDEEQIPGLEDESDEEFE